MVVLNNGCPSIFSDIRILGPPVCGTVGGVA